MKSTSALALLTAGLTSACAMFSGPGSVSSRPFGVQRDGLPVTAYTLSRGVLEVVVTDHGATLVALSAPDRFGQEADVVFGFDDVSGYESDRNQYFGCTTGRVCNRIKAGRFTLDGYDYALAVNNGPNHLHGGAQRSLDKVRWHAQMTRVDGAPAVVFSYRSPDGEEGYPGNLDVKVTYSLPADDEFSLPANAPEDLHERRPLHRIVPARECPVMSGRSAGDGKGDCRLFDVSQTKRVKLFHLTYLRRRRFRPLINIHRTQPGG